MLLYAKSILNQFAFVESRVRHGYQYAIRGCSSSVVVSKIESGQSGNDFSPFSLVVLDETSKDGPLVIICAQVPM
jgi:hypothetical protein